MHWKVFCASATGKHHLDSNLGCQDAAHHEPIEGGFIGVVCDGAGSASQGDAGAAYTARTFAALLAAPRRSAAPDGVVDTAAHADVMAAIDQIRHGLAQMARDCDLSLRDFACTLVACIVRDGVGRFIHVGDGFGICRDGAGACSVSLPENGEYADETYFITDDKWADHVRITTMPPLANGCLVGLMSDGAAPFAVNRPRTGFYPPFIEPIVAFLRHAPAGSGDEALLGVLASEKTFAITGDDKTLLLALAA